MRNLAGDVRHERSLACLLDLASNLTLVLGTESRAASWGDLHIGRYKASESADVLVIHNEAVVHAVVAGLGAGARGSVCFGVSHK